MPITLYRARLAEMAPTTLYRLLTLRVAVFVVEQRAAYPDLDGRDVEEGAELHWAEEGGPGDREVVSTLRLLREPGALRIGRVATAPSTRGRGVAAELMRAAVERCAQLDAAAPVLLDAQAHLAPWYARFGFTVAGPGFEEDGIPHLPMRREPAAPDRTELS